MTESFISEQQARAGIRSVNTQKKCLDSGRGGDGKSFREGRKGRKDGGKQKNRLKIGKSGSEDVKRSRSGRLTS